MSIEEKIVRFANELGFVAAGFAPAGASSGHAKFQEWIARGYAADMDYLVRQAPLRASLGNFDPHARSAIVTAVRYPVNDSPDRGFSSYAWGTDYHDVLSDLLNKLADFISSQTRLTLRRVCVDTSPVPERELAARAGIGWIGKQGQLINPEYGSCLLLGELLVDCALIPSQPMPNRCESCKRCVESCPTGAIAEDGTLDARRCISYLTIGRRGAIPSELCPLIGQSLYGCDRCTAVCPWNRCGDAGVLPALRGPEWHEETKQEPALRARQLPSPEECLAMDKASFKQRFHGTAVFRSGLDRLKRNATIVVENRSRASPQTALRRGEERQP